MPCDWWRSRWNRPDFDAILDAARAERDLSDRIPLNGKAQAMLWDEGGGLIPYDTVFPRAMSARGIGLEGLLGGDLPRWRIGLT